ncbi:MAG: YncE family protein [Muribaculaceae bacterium]|nr:YncE family protein [Muribaculaceae bacterium]
MTPSTQADGTLFVLNEGSFQFPSATLSVYNPETNKTLNEAFLKANGMKLGDVALSMTITNDSTGWVVVNNSNVVFAINPITQKEKGRITGLTSPRYFHQVNEKKAYITQMYDNRIAIVDPSTYSITGYIEVPGMEAVSGSTEQMVAYGDYVFCNCWSYQKNIVKIDTRTDQVVASKEVGIQPRYIALDCHDKLWVLTDGGGWDKNPIGYEAPTLVKIDPKTFNIEKKYEFELGDYCSKLCLNGKGDALYWIKGDVWKMDVNADALPTEPYIKSTGSVNYGLTIAPQSSEVYVADAIDYSQNGVVYRYSPDGKLLDQFTVGINPGGFCWYRP